MFISTESKTTLVLTHHDKFTLTIAKKLLEDINEAFSENPKIGYVPYEDIFDLIFEDNFYKEEGLNIIIK